MDGESQPNPIGPVRALLQRLATPLTGLEQLLQTADTLLAPLTPPLAELVEFTPFAQLTVSESGVPPSAPPPLRRGGAVTPATRQAIPSASVVEPSPLWAAAASPAVSKGEYASAVQSAPPVFSLAGRQQTGASTAPTADPWSPQERAMAWRAPSAAPELSTHTVSASVSPAQVVSVVEEHGSQSATQTALPASWLPPPAGLAAASLAAAAAPLTTMPLLATLTSALLAPSPAAAASLGAAPVTAPAPTVAHLASASREHQLSSLVGSSPRVGALTPLETPLRPDMAAATLAVNGDSAHDAALGVAAPPDEPVARWLAPTAPTVVQPDAWTLAQLINEVLSAEARRQGVDFT